MWTRFYLLNENNAARVDCGQLPGSMERAESCLTSEPACYTAEQMAR